MSTPNYSDIDKKFKDLYTKLFPAGLFKLNAKIPDTNGISLKLEEEYTIDTGALTQMFESKAVLTKMANNVTWIQKYTQKQEISTAIELKTNKNLTNTGEVIIDTKSGKSSLKMKNVFKNEILSATADIIFKSTKPEITVSTYYKIGNVLNFPMSCGGTINLNTSKARILDGMGYGIQVENANVTMSSTVTNNKVFQSHVFMKASSNWQVGWTMGWCNESKKANFGGVTQFTTPSGSILKSRIKQCGLLSLSFMWQIFPGINTTIGLDVNTSNINGGGHKFGLEVEL